LSVENTRRPKIANMLSIKARAYFVDIRFRELARIFSLFVIVVPSQDSVFVSTLAIPFIRNTVELISKICLLVFSGE
jgi:hypothetical protein